MIQEYLGNQYILVDYDCEMGTSKEYGSMGSLLVSDPQNRQNPSASAGEPQKHKEPSALYRVTILDNDTNTYQQVIDICMLALGISFQEAYYIALAIDNNGYAEVAHAPRSEAERIAGVIRSIGIEVTVEPVGPGAD